MYSAAVWALAEAKNAEKKRKKEKNIEWVHYLCYDKGRFLFLGQGSRSLASDPWRFLAQARLAQATRFVNEHFHILFSLFFASSADFFSWHNRQVLWRLLKLMMGLCHGGWVAFTNRWAGGVYKNVGGWRWEIGGWVASVPKWVAFRNGGWVAFEITALLSGCEL